MYRWMANVSVGPDVVLASSVLSIYHDSDLSH